MEFTLQDLVETEKNLKRSYLEKVFGKEIITIELPDTEGESNENCVRCTESITQRG